MQVLAYLDSNENRKICTYYDLDKNYYEVDLTHAASTSIIAVRRLMLLIIMSVMRLCSG